jgi:phage terminase large subunit GpA-like protein
MEVHPDLIPLQRAFLATFTPPDRSPICSWIEQNVYLSERNSPSSGRIKLWKHQKGLLEAIGDRSLPFITVIKAARTGYTKTLMGAAANYAANRPASIGLLVPTTDDARKISISEIGPLFAESPSLRGLLNTGRTGRHSDAETDTLTYKAFAHGGSLKILSARAPRNLRSHDIKILLIDECDAMEVTSEGDPIELAIKRTLAHADRKVVCGSTPTIEGLSFIHARYELSDKRIFEVPCPHCYSLFEMLWEHLTWPQDLPSEAYLICPTCHDPIDEAFKRQMVNEGDWRATVPTVLGHAGFRMNPLLSQFENARWGLLAEEFLRAKKGGPSQMMVFTNTTLGKVATFSLDSVDEKFLQAKVEPFDLTHFPREILLLTAGVDTQRDRVELCLLGWSQDNQPCVLGYFIFHGSVLEPYVWKDLDTFLQQKYQHPNGYLLGIDGTAIDSGGTGSGPESMTQAVHNFCDPRVYRRIYAIKGQGGPRPIWKQSFSKKARANKLFHVGVDQLKVELLERLAAMPFLDASGEPALTDSGHGRNPVSLRLSHSLPEVYFEQCSSERKYVKNRPKIEFRPIREGARNEALDASCYALAVRHALNFVNLKRRAEKRGDGKATVPTQALKPQASVGTVTASKPKRTMSSFGNLNS